MSPTNINNLFSSVHNLIKHQEELEKAKGETFNVFSILKMETKENDTHSNFLGNLLDPRGTHLKGGEFLNLFVEQIDALDAIDVESANVILEFSCGPTNQKTKTGGRIDIYIYDSFGNSLSIENKIYADDQPNQIERYVNHNKERNRVYYLTLHGKEPSKSSKGELKSGEDFFIISYQNDIVDWLDACIKESANEPILRESIKQYKILLQKLTKTMDNKHEAELHDLILKNYDAAAYIARNFDKAKETICFQLRESLVIKLNQLLLDTTYKAGAGAKITTPYAQIWIWNQELEGAKIHFGIEPFGTNASEKLFVGTFTYGDTEYEKLPEVNRKNQYWADLNYIPPFNGVELRVDNPELIKNISTSQDYLIEVTNYIADYFMTYFNEKKGQVENYLKKN